jgi:hypothetical protein
VKSEETGKVIGLGGAGQQELSVQTWGGVNNMRKDLHNTGTCSETKRVFRSWMTFTIHVLLVHGRNH